MSGPGGAARGGIRVTVRTRWDDCDGYGHVNNAAFLALMRAAHDRAGLPAAALRSVEIAYRRPILPDIVTSVDVVSLERAPAWWRVGYTFGVGERPAAEIRALWQLGAQRVEPDLPPVADDAGGVAFGFTHAVGSHEIGPDGAVRPQVILQLLEQAVFRAADRAGWPRGRMEAERFVTYVVGHQLILQTPARDGAALTVTSRLIELRRVSGTWHHEIRATDGSLVAADRARGAFLDLAGRIRPAPPGLMEDLLRGEPTHGGRAGRPAAPAGHSRRRPSHQPPRRG